MEVVCGREASSCRREQGAEKKVALGWLSPLPASFIYPRAPARRMMSPHQLILVGNTYSQVWFPSLLGDSKSIHVDSED